MNIVKIENPGMAYMLMPFYLDTWEPIAETTCRLYQMMDQEPDNTLLCAAVEDDRVHGVAMAYIDGKDCVVWQMNGMNAKQADIPITSWAKSRGCEKIVMYTDRNPKMWTKRHGFTLDESEEIEGKTKHTMSRVI